MGEISPASASLLCVIVTPGSKSSEDGVKNVDAAVLCKIIRTH